MEPLRQYFGDGLSINDILRARTSDQCFELANVLHDNNLGHSAFPRLESLVALVQKVIGVPYVGVSLAPSAEVFLIADIGLPKERQAPEANSFTKTCLANGGPIRISDLTNSTLFAHHPLVRGSPHVRSWLSCPIKSGQDSLVGALSCWDHRPREFTDQDAEMLVQFADLASLKIDLLRTHSESARRARLLEIIFDNAAVGISVSNARGERLAVNRYLCNILQCDLVEALQPGIVGSWTRPSGHPPDSSQHEESIRRKDGTLVRVRITESFVDGTEEAERLHIQIFEDIETRYRSEIARDLLIGEVNHRVKNTLAIVQGIAKQLLKTSATSDEFSSAFETRLQNIARSHDMLTAASWAPLSITALIEDAFRSLPDPQRSRISCNRLDVAVNAQTSIMLTMLLKELLANAIKHGALKSPDGTINIELSVVSKDETAWIQMRWVEQSSIAVQRPEKSGLGVYLIERAPRLGLGGQGTLVFDLTGVLFNLEFPVYPTRDVFPVRRVRD